LLPATPELANSLDGIADTAQHHEDEQRGKFTCVYSTIEELELNCIHEPLFEV